MDTSSERLTTALHKCRSGRSADRATAGACSSSEPICLEALDETTVVQVIRAGEPHSRVAALLRAGPGEVPGR
jgi:hypothetical protein